MPNTTVPAAGGAMSAACRVIRLKLAIWMLRTARKLSDRAAIIIHDEEDRAAIIIHDEEKEVRDAELLKAWGQLTPTEKREVLDQFLDMFGERGQ